MSESEHLDPAAADANSPSTNGGGGNLDQFLDSFWDEMDPQMMMTTTTSSQPFLVSTCPEKKRQRKQSTQDIASRNKKIKLTNELKANKRRKKKGLPPVSAIKKEVIHEPTTSTMATTNVSGMTHSQERENEEREDTELYYGSLLRKLVTHKDVVTETFLEKIIESLPQRNDMSATELYRLWKDEARKRITQYSVTLSHKLSPLVQIMLDQKLATSMENTFVEVETVQPSPCQMVKCYERCFNKWIDDDHCVSFKTSNTKLLGKVDIKDVYILTFFVFCTCRRTRNDNILQLGLVGCSTSGKSTLFESCLLEGSHVTTNEQGVGRFQVGNKPVLLFHDIEIRYLAMSKDTEKIKTIARTEPTVTKIHSSTYTLQPLFIFYSSNERLMTHKFKDSLPHQPFQWRLYHGQVNETLGLMGGRKKVADENLSALQNRFIEAFVRKPPKLDANDLPQSGGFQRMHGILGMYPRILSIMMKYDKEDFYSPVLSQYVLHGLCSNYLDYIKIMIFSTLKDSDEEDSDDDEEDSDDDKDEEHKKSVAYITSNASALKTCLHQLIAKHIHPSLQRSLLRFL